MDGRSELGVLSSRGGGAEERLAAMRTRDGVVDLAELREARRTAEFLRSSVGKLPLFHDVRVVLAAEDGFELEVSLLRESRQVRVCLPSSVNDVPVRVVVRNPELSAGSVSAPVLPSEP
jgi:hypothetical protein